jgi:hypothetical protein
MLFLQMRYEVLLTRPLLGATRTDYSVDARVRVEIPKRGLLELKFDNSQCSLLFWEHKNTVVAMVRLRSFILLLASGLAAASSWSFEDGSLSVQEMRGSELGAKKM